jgi:predicted patatin/cPLA2 family phospholipase
MKYSEITVFDETAVKVGRNIRNQHRLYQKFDDYIKDTEREVSIFVDNASAHLGVALRPEKLNKLQNDRRNEMGQV